MRKHLFTLAIACPLLAAAPSLAASFRPDTAGLFSTSDRREIVAPSASSADARQTALDHTARWSSFVHPSQAQVLALRRIYDPQAADVRAHFASDSPVAADREIATSVGNPGPDWQSPTGQDAVPAVPEPAAGLAFGLGALIVGFAAFRTKQRADATREISG